MSYRVYEPTPITDLFGAAPQDVDTAPSRDLLVSSPDSSSHLHNSVPGMLLPHYPCRLLHAERYSAQICSTVNEYSIMKGDIVCRGGDARQDLIIINTGIVTILCASGSNGRGMIS